MKTTFKTCDRVWPLLGVVLTFAFASGIVRADTIDFSGIANGTLVSSLNPSNGILDITATTTVDVYDGTIHKTTTEARINGGVLEALPGYMLGAVDCESNLTATFLVPVTEVSFQLSNWRTVGFMYTGVDTSGAAFSATGVLEGAVEDPSREWWSTVSLAIPDGGYLTGFTVSNRDPRPGDAAFWMNDISYTPVPEAGATVALLGGALAALAVMRRARRQAS